MEKGNLNKMKIVFLDIDGVLSHPGSGWRLDSKKIKLIEEIIKATDAKIVISSSWAVGCRTGEEFVQRELSDGMKETLFYKSIIDVTEQAEYWNDSRGQQINRWLEKHEVESYVIIDDDCDMLEEQLFNFIQTDTYEGITEREVKMSISVLLDKRIDEPIRMNRTLLCKWYDANPPEKRVDNYYDLLKKYWLKTENK